MAEAVLLDLIAKKGLENKFVVDSAGTGDYHIGEPPHEGTINKLNEKGINSQGLIARQVSKEDFLHFDYIVAMDDDNINALKNFKSDESKAVVKKLLDYVPNAKTKNVPDPYFTGDFEETYQLVEEGCKYLLDEIRSEKDID